MISGYETSRDAFADAVEEEHIRQLPQPIGARQNFRIVHEEDGFHYRHVDDILEARDRELLRRLRHAIAMLRAGGKPEEVAESFDAAYLVHPWNIVATTLRVGVAALQRDWDRDWYTQCIQDWERCIELHGSIDSILSHPLIRKLDTPSDTLQQLISQAILARMAWYQDAGDLERPVPESLQLQGAALALLRRGWGVKPKLRLPHSLIRAAQQGEPDALRQVDQLLRDVEEWATYKAMIESNADPTETWENSQERSRWLLSCRSTDLLRFARNFYRLELGAESQDRLQTWKAFLGKTAGLGRYHSAVRPWEQGELMARELRERLLRPDGCISSANELVFREAGVFVGVTVLTGQVTSAAAALPRIGPPCIFTEEAARPEGRRRLVNRFSIMHELAHLIADRHAERCTWTCLLGLEENETVERAEDERRANAFAYYFLAPRQDVHARIPKPASIYSSEFIVAAMALRREFGLSAVAAGEHLANCYPDLRSKLSGPLPHVIRKQLFDRANEAGQTLDMFAKDETLDAPSPTATGVRRRLWAGRYQALVHRLSRSDYLDKKEAAMLLGQDELEAASG